MAILRLIVDGQAVASVDTESPTAQRPIDLSPDDWASLEVACSEAEAVAMAATPATAD